MYKINLRKKLIIRIISLIFIIIFAITAMYLFYYLPLQVSVYRWTPLSIALMIMGVGLIISAFLYEFRDEASIRDK